MKIRMRHNHQVVEDMGAHWTRNGNLFLRRGSLDGMYDAFDDREWEEVQPEQWVDVSAEIVVVDQPGCKSIAGVFHNGVQLAALMCGGKYRLEKYTGCRNIGCIECHHVQFRIMKRVP